nr:1040_t:CDS:2 [Entrophospora candida]
MVVLLKLGNQEIKLTFFSIPSKSFFVNGCTSHCCSCERGEEKAEICDDDVDEFVVGVVEVVEVEIVEVDTVADIDGYEDEEENLEFGIVLE